jgi:hypothetical protein
MNFKRNALLAILGLALAGGAVTGASAETLHPRRDQVNDRLQHQAVRIHEARRDGDVSAREAWRLHRADGRVRRQEVRFARHHDGHITRREQVRLNHEENRISRNIPG